MRILGKLGGLRHEPPVYDRYLSRCVSTLLVGRNRSLSLINKSGRNEFKRTYRMTCRPLRNPPTYILDSLHTHRSVRPKTYTAHAYSHYLHREEMNMCQRVGCACKHILQSEVYAYKEKLPDAARLTTYPAQHHIFDRPIQRSQSTLPLSSCVR